MEYDINYLGISLRHHQGLNHQRPLQKMADYRSVISEGSSQVGRWVIGLSNVSLNSSLVQKLFDAIR